MVSGGEHIDMTAVELFYDLAGHAESGSRIFAIGDDQINPLLLDDPGKQLADRPSSRFADDVSNKEYLQSS
ncbi:MAG: hypothetical protein ACD_87C00200G0002 [uncultured bacterium]|nr:MAG: hypothetical protein ACD_87C00200G0002 [uncultured bacterium]